MRKRMMEKLRKISTMYYLKQIVACLLVYCILLAVPMQVALATPAPADGVGPSVGLYTATAGSASVDLPGTTTTIDAPHGSIFDWQNFDIGYGHTVNHVDYGIDAAVLHRINVTNGWGDGFATGINGNLNAPGNLFVVNPRGIVIGADAMIAAHRFVASGLKMTDTDFLNFIDGAIDVLRFEGYDDGTLGVELKADGQITADTVGLIGKSVVNAGIITSNTVVLAAGQRVYLTATDIGGKIFVEVADLVTPDPAEHVVDNGGSQGAGPGKINATEQVLLAAGDIYSAAITGVGKLAAVANRDVTLVGDIQAGEITVDAGRDAALASDKTMISSGDLSVTAGRDIMLGDDLSDSDPTVGSAGNVYANGDLTLDAEGSIYAHGLLYTLLNGPGGNINLYSSDSTTHLYGNVSADVDDDGDIILHNVSEVAHGVTLTAGDDVRAFNLLTAKGDLTIVATRGEIEATAVNMGATDSLLSLTQNDNLDIENALDIVYNSSENHLFAKSTGTDPLENEGSVTSFAAADWRSITAEAYKNITLSDESGNITTKDLYAEFGDIKITANDGKLFAYGPISAGRDVKITATDEGSDAIFLYEDVDAGRDIWLNNNTYAYGPISLTAGQDMRLGYNENLDKYDAKTLTAENSLTIEADRHVTLGGDVTVIGSMPETLIVKADADTVNEEDEPVPGGDVWAKGKLTTIGGEENHILVYGDNIQVDGMVSSAANVEMTAFDDLILASNVEAGGSIDLYSSDNTTYLGGDLIKAAGDLTLHNKTELNGTDDPTTISVDESNQRIEAETGTLTAMKDVDKSTEGSMTLAGASGITLSGDVTGSGLTSDDAIIFEGNVTANGIVDAKDQRFDAGLGALWAQGTITKNAGEDLTLGGDEGIDLDGTVDVLTNRLFIEDDFTAEGDLLANNDIIIRKTLTHSDTWVNGEFDGTGNQKVEARNLGRLLVNTAEWPDSDEPYLEKTTAGDLELHSGSSLILHAHVTVEQGKLDIIGGAPGSGVGLMGNLWSSGDMTLTSNGGGLGLEGNAESEGGSVKMSANGWGIRLYSRSWGRDVTAGQDIVLNDDTTVYYSGAVLDAGQDVILAFNEDITSNYDLTINAGDDIILGALNPANPGAVGTSGDVTADGHLILTAGDDIYAHGTLSTETDSGGNITATAVDDIHLYKIQTSADADGTLILTADSDDGLGGDGGDLTVDGALYGNMELSGVDVTVYGDVVSDGTLDVDADSDIELRANVSSEGEMTMDAGDEIIIGEAFSGNGNVTANDNIRIWAGDEWNDDVIVYGKLTTTNGGNIDVRAGDDITIWGTLDGPVYESVEADGALTMSSNTSGSGFLGGDLYIAGDTIAESMILEAGVVGADGEGSPDSALGFSDSRVQVDGLLRTTGGNMVVRAHHDVLLGGNVDSAGDLVLNADRHGNEHSGHIHGGDVLVEGTVDAGGTIDMYGNNITLEKDVTSVGNMTLTADTSHDFNPQPGDLEGDVVAMGNLTSTGGDIEIYSSSLPGGPGGSLTTYLGGDRVQAYGNILLNNNTVFTSDDDQKVDAQTGTITANGWLWKFSPWGSLYLEAAGDVSLAHSVKADNGGVSIISENGTIFTPDELGDPTDTLNVPISGTSNYETGAGVKLHPDMDNKAAIVIISKADLKLGKDAVLTASGMYDNSGAVDDRAAMGLLDDGDPLTATIGGVLRDEGDPFDAAIYLASTDGDVDVSGPVTITSYNMILDGYLNGNDNGNDERPEYGYVHQGAMVIDAFDTVTFDGQIGGQFETSLAAGQVGNRLEVVSRITEWLFQAVGRLPFVYDPTAIAAFEEFIGGDYILRGAGLDNPDIAATTDGRGRAWVLEDPLNPAPLYEEAGQALEPLTLGLAGCPVLVAAVSVELGVPGDTIEVSLANSFALNTNIQPCESCARLLNAATILRDEDGSGMAALNQVFNTVAPAGVPFTPEMAASIATAFAGRVNDGTQYATAIEYIDAFVRYLAVLDTEMGSPVADGDSIAFVMGKYGTGITESENSNIAAFIATRLESSETFGE